MALLGSPFDFISAFLGGVLVSFTPCIYPLIPISAGFIGIRAGGSNLKGLILSVSYVTGLAVTYSALGLFASLTGTFFGKASSSPITYFLAGAIIIFFGLSLLDLFIVPLPGIIKRPVFKKIAFGDNLLPAGRQVSDFRSGIGKCFTPAPQEHTFLYHKKQNYFSAFLLGLSSGLIASPCLTPVLGSILAYLAAKKNLLYGAALLFSFAYGMGLSLILIGTSSAVLVNLPKAGRWSVYAKKSCAFLLLGMGVYLIYTGIRRL